LKPTEEGTNAKTLVDGAGHTLMHKLPKKYCLIPKKLITNDPRSYAAAALISESRTAHSVVVGATIEPGIRINRPDDENIKCIVSRAPV
jgi:hypothetical protein